MSSSTLHHTENEVDILLQKYSDSLKANEDYINEGVELCERMLKRLKKECSDNKKLTFSIARVHYAGSVEKHTDVLTPDYDLVLELNNKDPNSTDILALFATSLDFFKACLTRNANSLMIKKTSIKQLKKLIQFDFENGMSVDLLPAVASLSSADVRSLIKKHRTSKDPSKNKICSYYSSSRVGEQIGFMKKQSGFTHRLARIAKYWYKSVDFGDEKITGGSLIFELLSAEAVLTLRKEGHEGEPMLKAFCRVLEHVERLDKIKLAFKETHNGDWAVMTEGDTMCDGAGQVPRLHPGPYILEPGNLYNNILEGMSTAVMERFMDHAQHHLANLRSRRGTFDVETLSYKPPVLVPSLAALTISDSSPAAAYVIRALPPKKFMTKAGIVIRNSSLQPDKRALANVLTTTMIPVVGKHSSSSFGGEELSKSAKRKRCKIFMETMRAAVRRNFSGLVNSQKQKYLKMKSFDIVVIIPFYSVECQCCIMIGLGWTPSALSCIERSLFY